VLVLETPDGVVGTVMAGLDGHRGWVYYLAVDPVRRGLGHGRRLMVAAEAWLLGEGARKVQLMVREGNDVTGFYEALGYADQSTRVLGRWLEEPAGRPQD
jgi:ribosomal protein S18 acetylase RimI-like enzyme